MMLLYASIGLLATIGASKQPDRAANLCSCAIVSRSHKSALTCMGSIPFSPFAVGAF